MHHYILFICFYCCCTLPRQQCQSWTITQFLSQHHVTLLYLLDIPAVFCCCCCWHCSFLYPEKYGVKNIILYNYLIESSASLYSFFAISYIQRNNKATSLVFVFLLDSYLNGCPLYFVLCPIVLRCLIITNCTWSNNCIFKRMCVQKFLFLLYACD